MSIESQLRERVLRYLAGEGSLEDFENWFAPLSWNIEASKEEGAIVLAHRIEGLLAEASSAEWEEDTIRRELTKIAPAYSPSILRALQSGTVSNAEVWSKPLRRTRR